MTFFDSELAATLQYYTLPLELIGLTLATVEVRFPKIAHRLHQTLIRDTGRLQQEADVGFLETIRNSKTIRASLVIYIAFASVVGVSQNSLLVFLGLALAPILLIPILSLSLKIQQSGLQFIIGWVPDRSVGTLGIVVAGIGVLGEAYQLATQLVT